MPRKNERQEFKNTADFGIPELNPVYREALDALEQRVEDPEEAVLEELVVDAARLYAKVRPAFNRGSGGPYAATRQVRETLLGADPPQTEAREQVDLGISIIKGFITDANNNIHNL
ncbi:MAG TPA: hypothetical protein VK674_06200 [Candidatus Limnocylindria bacterium]|nr:hypothetical protein [Candidatus Limnocylindria bacterium]